MLKLLFWRGNSGIKKGTLAGHVDFRVKPINQLTVQMPTSQSTCKTATKTTTAKLIKWDNHIRHCLFFLVSKHIGLAIRHVYKPERLWLGLESWFDKHWITNHFRFNRAKSKSSRPCAKLSKTSTAFQSPTRPRSPSNAKKSQFSSKKSKECTILVKCSTNQNDTDKYALTKCKYEHYLLAVQKTGFNKLLLA